VIAAVPTFITDLATLLGFLIALIAFSIAVAKIQWLRRVWNYIFVTPLSKWFRNEVTEAAAPINAKMDVHAKRVDDHIKYVRTQLGPNGTTPPIHERLIALERRFGITHPRDPNQPTQLKLIHDDDEPDTLAP
jgi:hypothetical protein